MTDDPKKPDEPKKKPVVHRLKAEDFHLESPTVAPQEPEKEPPKR